VFLDNEESALELLEHGIDKIFMKKAKERNLYYGRSEGMAAALCQAPSRLLQRR
jgi:hypothetical protein